MPVSKNRQFAKIANDVNTSGTLTAAAISSDVTLGGATIYASRSNLPTSGNTAGDQAYVTDNNRLYIWNGSGWYNIALLNLAPSIQSVLDSDGGTTPFSLSTDGSVTTITITAADSDGDPITYSSTADSDFSGLATVSQANNVFTITPFSEASATTTSGTITFTATDGVNVATSGLQTFTLSFIVDWSSNSSLQQLLAPDTTDLQQAFGLSVDFYDDTLVVGNPYEPPQPAGNQNEGRVYVYTRSGSTWSLEQKISAPTPATSAQFGAAVAVDNDTLAVCSPGLVTNSDRIFLYTRSGSTWTYQTQFSPGWRSQLGLQLHNGTLVYTDYSYAGNQGRVYIYTGSGSSWTLQQTIDGPAGGSYFGICVALDNDTLAVGASGYNGGSVLVYTRSGSTWSLQQTLAQISGTSFGRYIDVKDNDLIIGARDVTNSHNSDGSAYVYTRSGSTWTLQQTLEKPGIHANYDYFGAGVSIDGDNLVVAAPFDDTYAGNAGGLYVFNRSGSTWSHVKTFRPNGSLERLGSQSINNVVLKNRTLVSGAVKDYNAATGFGKTYVFYAQ